MSNQANATKKAAVLSLVAPQREPWARQEGESEEEHLQFLAWLLSTPRRAPKLAQLAQDFEWAARARAYDQQLAAPPTSKGKLSASFNAMTELCHLELSKMLKLARTENIATTSINDLVRLMSFLTQGDALAELLASADGDMTPEMAAKCSDEELQVVEEFSKIVKKLRGGKT